MPACSYLIIIIKIMEGQHSRKVAASSSSSQRLREKVAIITGGASGLGESIARLFAEHGAKVIIADLQDDKGESLCKEITLGSNNSSFNNNNNNNNNNNATTAAAPAPALYSHCDVTDDSDMEAVVNLAISTYGKLDIMFNNAGITGDVNPTIIGTDNHNFKRVFDVNVYGAFLGAKHAARVMIPAKKGVILFTSSIASVLGGESPHAYTVSKHAVVGLMKGLCVELGQYGIRVNALSPCAVSTPLLRNAMGREKGFVDKVIHDASVLKGVVPTEGDIAEAALYLASDDAKYVSGHNLVVDGGYTITNGSFNVVLGNMMLNGH